MLCKKVSDEVRTGDILAYVHANNEELSAKAVKDLEEVYKIGDIKPKRLEVILGIVK